MTVENQCFEFHLLKILKAKSEIGRCTTISGSEIDYTSHKNNSRKMKLHLAIEEYTGYIFRQLFLWRL